MKNSKFEKFEKDQISSLSSIKGGTLAGETSTTKNRTDETSNDIDSNSDIEGKVVKETHTN